jgi:hypothetical protein
MKRKLIALISVQGKSTKQVVSEAWKKFQKYKKDQFVGGNENLNNKKN